MPTPQSSVWEKMSSSFCRCEMSILLLSVRAEVGFEPEQPNSRACVSNHCPSLPLEPHICCNLKAHESVPQSVREPGSCQGNMATLIVSALDVVCGSPDTTIKFIFHLPGHTGRQHVQNYPSETQSVHPVPWEAGINVEEGFGCVYRCLSLRRAL